MLSDLCPTCSLPAIVRCRCILGEMRCASGHQWFHCGNCGSVVVGESDHAKSIDDPVNLCVRCRAVPGEKEEKP